MLQSWRYKWRDPCVVHSLSCFSPPQPSGSLLRQPMLGKFTSVSWTEAIPLKCVSMSRSRTLKGWSEPILRGRSIQFAPLRQPVRLTPQVGRLLNQATVINLGGQGANLCGEIPSGTLVSADPPSPIKAGTQCPAFSFPLKK